jgi:hypothetical protein
MLMKVSPVYAFSRTLANVSSLMHVNNIGGGRPVGDRLRVDRCVRGHLAERNAAALERSPSQHKATEVPRLGR